jgi:Fe-S-cluster-containing hydrogenase component 2
MNATEPSDSAAPDETGQFKTVTQQAAVCDLCSSTRAQQPLCVYACPHDAAMRVNSQDFFFNHTGAD